MQVNAQDGKTKRDFFGTTSRVLAIGLILLLVALLGEASLDIYFEEESFVEAILAPTPHELAIRMLFVGILLVFVLYNTWMWHKRNQLESALHKALNDTEMERSKTVAILDAVGDCISIQDTALRVIYQNRAHIELMGQHLGEYCHAAYQGKDDVCAGCHLLSSFLDGQVHRREASAPGKRGIVHVEVISTPLRDPDGNIIAGIESIRDITDRKLAEQDILRLNAELERKTRELTVCNHELEAFSYSLSHDLKTPLTIISSAGQILDETCRDRLDETGQYLVDQINKASDRMDGLLDAMLQLALMSRAELQRDTIDLGAIAGEIAANLQESDLERRVDWTIAAPVTGYGDPRLLRSLMENLLGNAWKYTAKTAAAAIAFGTMEQAGQQVYFVRDNGIGFDMQHVDRLFRPFQRLHGSESFAGSGIGLASVQQIVKRHGGTIWAEAEPGRGATFYFTLDNKV